LIVEELGFDPQHLLIPELSIEDAYSVSLWDQIKDQLRISPIGNPYALDISAIANYFTILGIQDVDRQIKKMRVIFEEIVLKGQAR
jgi:hypothetical protein